MNTRLNRNILVTSAGTLLLTLALGASAEPVAPSVQLIAVNGSGCPDRQGTVVQIAPDWSSFSVLFSGYSLTQGRRNCMFVFNVTAPSGYTTYGVTDIELSGNATLASDATAQAGAYYYFQGESDTTYLNQPISASGPWVATGPFTPVLYNPGTNYLVVNTSLRISGGAPEASSVSMDPSFDLYLEWQ